MKRSELDNVVNFLKRTAALFALMLLFALLFGAALASCENTADNPQKMMIIMAKKKAAIAEAERLEAEREAAARAEAERAAQEAAALAAQETVQRAQVQAGYVTFRGTAGVAQISAAPKEVSGLISRLASDATRQSLADTISKSALPNVNDAAVYELFAEATADGMEKVVGTFGQAGTASARQFEMALALGHTWTVTCGIRRKDNKKAALSDSCVFEASADDPVLSRAFTPVPSAATTGNVELSFEIPAGVASATASCSAEDWTSAMGTDPVALTVTAGSSASLVINSLKSGAYDVLFSFCDANGIPLYSTTQTVSVLDNMTTNWWSAYGGTADTPISGGSFAITSAVIEQFASSIIYVGATSIGAEPSDATGDGSPGLPLATLGRAMQKIQATSNSQKSFTVYVSGNQKFAGTADGACWETPSRSVVSSISIVGVNGIDAATGEPKDALDGDGKGTVLAANCPIVLKNIKITGGNGSLGGGIFQKQWGQVTLAEGSLIKDNSAQKGGGVYVGDTSGGELLISGGTIKDNTAQSMGGGVYLESGRKAKMTSGLISANRISQEEYNGNYGGMALWLEGGQWTMTGGEISGNNGNNLNSRGAVRLQNSATFNLSGGKVAGNSAKRIGGNFFVADSTLNMTGGEISGGTAGYEGTSYDAQGGGVMICGSGSFNMSGGTLSGNKLICKNGADASGAGICTWAPAKVKITGGVLKDNSIAGSSASAVPKKKGGAIFVDSSYDSGAGTYSFAELTIGGAANIPYGDEIGKNDVFVCRANPDDNGGKYSLIKVTSLNPPAGVEKVAAITPDGWQRNLDIVKAQGISIDSLKEKISLSDGEFYFSKNAGDASLAKIKAPIFVKQGGKDDDTASGTQSNPYGSLKYAVGKLAGGEDDVIKIEGSLLGVQQEIPESFTTAQCASLTIRGAADFNGDLPTDEINRNIFGSSSGEPAGIAGSALLVESEVPITIENLKITGGYSTNGGGGIRITKSGALMRLGDGAWISKNATTADNQPGGGGVYVASGARLFMFGKALLGNKNSAIPGSESNAVNYSNKNGGGIYNEGEVYIGYKGFKADGSTPDAEGAEVAAGYGMRGNYSAQNGGAICNIGKLKIASGEIASNGSANGGGIYVKESSTGLAELCGGIITANEATSGGGVYVAANADHSLCASLYVYGDAWIGDKITDSSTAAAGHTPGTDCANHGRLGGGIFNKGKVYLGYKPSGASYALAEGTDAWTGGVCKNAAEYGGGIDNEADSAFMMAAGKVSCNRGLSNSGSMGTGGGIYSDTSDAEISGGEICKNISVNGGGVYFTGSKTPALKGGKIAGNELKAGIATAKGGAIYSSAETINVSGSIYIPKGAAETDPINDVYLYGDKYLNIVGVLNPPTEAGGVAIGALTPSEWKRGKQVIKGNGSDSDGTTVNVNWNKFKMSDAEWKVIKHPSSDPSYSNQGVMDTDYIYVAGATKVAGSGIEAPPASDRRGTKARPYASITEASKQCYAYKDFTIRISGKIGSASEREFIGSDTTANKITIEGANGDNTKDIIDRGLTTATDSGSALEVSSSAHINADGGIAIKNLKITGGATTNNGGGILLGKLCNLTLGQGALICGNAAKYGGGISYIQNNSNVKLAMLSGSEISGNSAEEKGGGIYICLAKLYMSGTALIGQKVSGTANATKAAYKNSDADKAYSNFAKSGGGVYCDEGAAIYLGYTTDDTITDDSKLADDAGILFNYSTENGGGICAATSNSYITNIYMASGNVSNNGCSSTHSGGGIYLGDGSQFSQLTMTGGKIDCNHAGNGGGVYLNTTGALLMSGGSMSGNTADTAGGAVYANETSSSGSSFGFQIQGSANLYTSSNAEKANDVYIADTKVIGITGNLSKDHVATLTPGAATWQRGTTSVISQSSYTEGNKSKFNISDPDWKIELKESSGNRTGVIDADIWVAGKGTETNPVTLSPGVGDNAKDGDVVIGKAPSDSNRGTKTQPYASLSKAVDACWDTAATKTKDFTIYIDGTVTGSQQIGNSASSDTAKAIYAKQLTLQGYIPEDATASTATLDGNSGDSNSITTLVINASRNASKGESIIIKNLKITGGKNTAPNGKGGGIYLKNGVVHLADGAVVAGNKAEKGGGVYIDRSSQLFMYGKAMIGDTINRPALSGNDVVGGVSIAGHSNYASDSGGGIYNEGSLYLGMSTNTGGDYLDSGYGVFRNYAANYGGGIYNDLTFKSRGDISYNGSGKNGGAAYLYANATFICGTLKENNAGRNGGALYIMNGETATLQGDTAKPLTLEENYIEKTVASGEGESAASGGAVYNNGTLNITGFTKMTGNYIKAGCSSNGANLYAQGGAIYNYGTVNITSTTATEFTGNYVEVVDESNGGHAYAYGGAVYQAGTFNISNKANLYDANASEKHNDVYLAISSSSMKTITVTGALSETNVAVITPSSWVRGTAALTGSSYFSGTTASTYLSKFKTTDSLNEWSFTAHDSKGKLDAEIWVAGKGTDTNSVTLSSGVGDNAKSGATVIGKAPSNSNTGTKTQPYADIAAAVAACWDDATTKTKTFTINVDGTVVGKHEIPNTIKAAGLNITGLTANATLDGNNVSSDKAVLGISAATTTFPVVITNLKVTGGNSTNDGGGVKISKGTLKLGDNVAVFGNIAYLNGGGGGIYVGADASLFMYGSSIVGAAATAAPTGQASASNFTPGEGGGIYSAGKVYIGYSELTDNDPTKPTGTAMADDVPDDGKYYGVIGNYATEKGGGIYNDGGTVMIKKGKITYNGSNGNGGGICLNKGTVKLGDNSMIAGNIVTGNGGGVCLAGSGANLFMSGKALVGDASNPLQAADNYNRSNRAANGGGVYLDSGVSMYVGYSGASSIAAVDYGYGVRRNYATSNGGGIYVSSGSSVYMGSGCVAKNGAGGNGGGICSAGNVYLHTDALVGDSSTSVAKDNQHSNAAQLGGGIWNSGTLKLGHNGSSATALNDGKGVVRNLGKGGGGGIYNSDGTAEILYGVVSFNLASAGSNPGTPNKDGGGINCAGGSLTISGGTIAGNSATGKGGGVAAAGGTFSMTGGTIGDASKDSPAKKEGNSYSNWNGGLWVNVDNASVTGGTIAYNYGSMGGGIDLWGTNLTINGNVVIKCNGGEHGGGLCIRGSKTAKIAKASFETNEVSSQGGAIYLYSNSSVLKMNEASFPNSSEKHNDIFLVGTSTSLAKIVMTGAGPSGSGALAVITPDSYSTTPAILGVEGSGVSLADVTKRFAVAPNGTEQWSVSATGKLVKGITANGIAAFLSTQAANVKTSPHDLQITVSTASAEATNADITAISEAIKNGGRFVNVTFTNSTLSSLPEIYAFSYCTYLTGITLPEGLSSIPQYTFYSCSNLTSVTLPNSVTTLGASCFADCSSLASIEFPSGFTGLSSFAFTRAGLTSVTIPASVTSFSGMGFTGCSKLESFTVESGNANYKSVSGVVYSKDGKKIVAIPTGKTGDYTIASGTEEIYRYCCCSGKLTSVTIPASVTKIGDSAFTNCLTSITFQGTKEQWNSVTKTDGWYENLRTTYVTCTNGTVPLN